jgi:hypothetical protein
MTMAPSRRKHGIWLEIIFVCVLLFLLAGARSQAGRDESGPKEDAAVHRMHPVLSTATSYR